MSKVSDLLSNIFRKRSSKLEIDALPVSDATTRQLNYENPNDNRIMSSSHQAIDDYNDSSVSNNRQNSETSSEYDYINNSLNQSLSLLSTNNLNIHNNNNSENISINSSLNQNQQLNPIETIPIVSSPANINNNSIAISNTQGHITYQFSNIDGLHIGPVINVQNNNNTNNNNTINTNKSNVNEQKKQKFKRKTRTIQMMMESKELLNLKMIDCISTHLGEGWKDIMRILNYSEGQIHQAYVDYYIEGLKEVIFQLILEWSRNEENANLGEITKILWKAGHRETVYYMKISWKENNNMNFNNESET